MENRQKEYYDGGKNPKKKEVGSEFWNVPVSNTENSVFPFDTKWFLSGRHALEYIVIDSCIRSISMPRWCCGSMVEPFRKHGVAVFFYDKTPDFSHDAVFLIEYFGFTSKAAVAKPKAYKGIVIRDVTHSLFSKTFTDADYYFGSLRKWAGFATGGFAWGKWKSDNPIPKFDVEYVDLRLKAFSLKKKYIEGKTSNKSFLDVFKKANERLSHLSFCGALPDDIEKAKFLDVEFIKKTRRRNAGYLIRHLKLPLKMNRNDVPLFVPLFLERRDEVKKFLTEHNIYCPVHWADYDCEGTELSLVCDQRYGLEDMKETVRLIMAECFGGEK